EEARVGLGGRAVAVTDPAGTSDVTGHVTRVLAVEAALVLAMVRAVVARMRALPVAVAGGLRRAVGGRLPCPRVVVGGAAAGRLRTGRLARVRRRRRPGRPRLGLRAVHVAGG